MSTDPDLDPDRPDDDAPGTVIDRTANNRRDAPDVIDQPLGDIDDVEPDDTDDDPSEWSGDVELAAWPVSPLRNPLEQFARRPLPTLANIRRSAFWWGHMLALAALQILLHLPQITWNQVPHTARGVSIAAGAYARYRGKGRWEEAAHAADANVRALRVEKVEHAKRGATRLTALTLVLFASLSTFLLLAGLTVWLLVLIGLLVFVLNLVGRRQAPTHSGVDIMPSSPFTEGAPSRMVVADVRAVLIERGHDENRLAIGEVRVGEYGLEMEIHSPREIDDKDALAIERGVQTFRGAAHTIAEPGNAARTRLRLMWKDPLAASYPPLRCAPNSQTVADPAIVGYGLGGAVLTLNLMRVNVIIVGGPGSGKSSTHWVLIDHLSTCRDVILHGIDLSGGPMLSAWGDVFETRASSPEEAKRLLQERIASAMRRTKMLAKRSEPSLEGGVIGSENWEPSDGKFHVLIIDELPLFANHPELLALLGEHQRIGRKAGETSVAATQSLDKDTLGATSLRKYPSTVIMHACDAQDVTMALGGDKIKQGWQPHRFLPAEGDSPNDAGKCYVKSGQHNRPVPWRIYRLDALSEIHDRAIERIRAGRPVDDDQPSTPVADEAEVVPEIVTDVLAVFTAAGDPEFLGTETILDGLNEGIDDPKKKITGQQLAARLRKAGVEGDRHRVDGTSTRGYWRDHVAQGVEQPVP